MKNRVLQVPISLLSNPDLTASAKVIWMARRLQPGACPAELEALTGLSRNTIRSGLGQVTGIHTAPGGLRVKVPGALLADCTVGAQAKVLYGLIQNIAGFRGQGGQFTYTSLCSQTQLSRNTLKHAIAELVGARWIRTTQASRLSPIDFILGSPALSQSLAEVAAAKRRLQRAKFGGEAIMQEYLSLLIDSDQFTENARPGFLVSPLTQERLELDRFYPPNVAFEFHGAQHFGATARVSREEAEAQHLRDLIKAGICVYQGIHLTIITANDLSLQGMRKKIGQSMPLRNLAGHEPLIDLLEEASLAYRAATTKGAP